MLLLVSAVYLLRRNEVLVQRQQRSGTPTREDLPYSNGYLLHSNPAHGRRSQAGLLFEEVIEMGRLVEAQAVANFGHVPVGVPQQGPGFAREALGDVDGVVLPVVSRTQWLR